VQHRKSLELQFDQDLVQKEHKLIEEYKELKDEIDARWEELIDADSSGETKMTQIWLNERAFNLAVKNHVDDIECIDNCRIYWNNPWGASVLVKLDCTKAQFDGINSIF
jgi:hypothetical protein